MPIPTRTPYLLRILQPLTLAIVGLLGGHVVLWPGQARAQVVVTITSPAGGESWAGGSGTAQTVTWTAPGASRVEIFYRDSESAPSWTRLSRGFASYRLSNSGSFTWFVPNTPTTEARIRIVAYNLGNTVVGESQSNLFTITQQPGGRLATTMRDFHQPGTQPLESRPFLSVTVCQGCHNVGTPPTGTTLAGTSLEFAGTMMSQAAHDPLFYAALAIAEQDAPSSGDLCIRCHSPVGWLGGHSQPTSGSQLVAADREGVACAVCHRMVDPIYQAGTSPIEDQPILDSMLPAHVPAGYSNGQYVIDPDINMRRGPYPPIAGHGHTPNLESPFHLSSNLCGTCHDVSNPVLDRVGTSADYVPGPLDQAASLISSHGLMPLERTYSEWKNSAYPGGVSNPNFGMVSECQDCHMTPDGTTPDTSTCFAGPIRTNLPRHDFTGGNVWMPGVIRNAAQYPGETDGVALTTAAGRAAAMLAGAASVDVEVHPGPDGPVASVKVTNRTGHKLPTGYPEGRRMWLNVIAKDAASQTVAEWGAYDTATGVLTENTGTTVYEAHLGMSSSMANTVGLPAGPSFHFVLNDKVYKDNRIPPEGFTNAAYSDFGGSPVDPNPQAPNPRYSDGQYWDVSTYTLPMTATSVEVRLKYQTTSKEYVEFLRDSNTTNGAGDFMHAQWVANTRSTPRVMKYVPKSIFTVSASAGGGGTISPSGAVTLSQGLDQVFTITPNPCYRVMNVIVDGASVGAVSSYTFTDVQASHTIAASFAYNTFTITATTLGGSISPSGAVSVSCGADKAFTMASPCYQLLNVSVDGVSVGAVPSYTFTNVQANHFISATFIASAPDPGSGVAGWWPGQGVYDATGNNHGTLVGSAGIQPGKIGFAFAFVQGSLVLADSPLLELTSQMTLDAWINPTDVGNAHLIISKFGGPPGNRAYQFGVAPGGALSCEISGDGSAVDNLTSATGLLTANTWAHVATTFDAGLWRIYVNGRIVATKISTITSLFAGGTITPTIGSGAAGSYYFVGLIDEPAVYHRALRGAEIAAIYDAGVVGRIRCADMDADGYLSSASSSPGDCDDRDPATHPNVPDAACNGIDSNCDGADGASCGCIQHAASVAGWWTANGTPNDSTGFSNGTGFGVSYGPGVVGTAFFFNGGPYVVIPDNPRLEFGLQMTLEAWINPLEVNSNRPIFSKFPPSGNRAYQIGLSSAGVLRADISSNGVSSDSLKSSPNLVTVGSWHHVATTFNSGVWSLYFDGELAASKTSTFPFIYTQGVATPMIGRNSGGTDTFFGRIDEVAAYPLALNRAQVKAIYNAGTLGMCGFGIPLAADERSSAPDHYALSSAWPNPIDRSTTVELALPAPTAVRVDVVDVVGRRVSMLKNERLAAGRHRLTWDGSDATGRRVPAGIYVIQVSAGAASGSRRVAIIK